MRILHVVPTFYPALHYGGPIYSLLSLCSHLTQLGCEIKVLTTDANGDTRLTPSQQRDTLLTPMRVEFCRRLGRGMVAPSLVPSVLRETAWADVIHLTAVYNFAIPPTLLAARFLERPLVWSPRGTLQRWAGSRRTASKSSWESLCRLLSPRRMMLHVTSEQEGAESAPRLGNPALCVIPNGIDIPQPPGLPVNDGVLKLLFIGRLDPKKGIENLISTVSILSRSSKIDCRLTVAGSGDPGYTARLHFRVTEAGLDSRVHFCGHLDGEDKHRAFAACDVVIVPSHTENFGVVIAEALAHSRPVIVSRGTPWRKVEEHKCGLWVDNDPSSLAGAICQVSRSDRVAMGQRGRAWMTSEFSWRDRARSMLTIYEQLAGA